MAALPSSFSSENSPISHPSISKSFFVGVIGISGSGKQVYAIAEITPQDRIIHLKFQTAQKIFLEMQNGLDKDPPTKKYIEDIIRVTKDENVYGGKWSFSLGDESKLLRKQVKKECKKITHVLINLPLPYSPLIKDLEFSKLNSVLIFEIGEFCRKMFPNMDPRESAYNLHFGFSSYHADEQLLPSATQHVVIKPK